MNGDDDVITDPDDPRLPINEQVAAPQVPVAEPPQVAEATVPQPLEGVTPEAPEEGGVEMELPQGPAGEGPSADVRMMYYGRNFGEKNHAANYHEGRELQDHDVALSPNVAHGLGLKVGDWVWVGSQLRRYGDVSAVADSGGGFSHYTNDSVEVRDYPADGRTTLRKASPQDVASLAPGVEAGMHPLEMQQAMNMTGKDASQITAEDVNRVIQNVPSRSLVAGEPTDATIEAAQEMEQNPDYVADDDVTTGQLGAEATQGTGDSTVIRGDISPPSSAHAKLAQRHPDGTLEYDNGVKYHPNTDTLEWEMAGRTFMQTGRGGKAISYPTNKFQRDPTTGEYLNLNKIDPATGAPTKVRMPGQSPAFNQSWSEQEARKNLSAEDRATVDMFGNYQAPMMTRTGRLNPEYQRLRGYISKLYPKIDPTNYLPRQQMKTDMASTKNGTLGQRKFSSNLAIRHMGQLWDLADALPEGKLKKFNNLRNLFNTETGDPSVTNFQNELNVVIGELTKAVKGGVPDQGDINRYMAVMGPGGSKAQIRQGIQTMANELGSNFETIRDQYKDTMGVDYDDDKRKLINPDAFNAVKKMGLPEFAGIQTGVKAGGATPTATPSATPTQKNDVITLKDGRVVRVIGVRPDGKLEIVPAQ